MSILHIGLCFFVTVELDVEVGACEENESNDDNEEYGKFIKNGAVVFCTFINYMYMVLIHKFKFLT